MVPAPRYPHEFSIPSFIPALDSATVVAFRTRSLGVMEKMIKKQGDPLSTGRPRCILWWRWRESNSRPEAINTSLYVRS